MHTIFVAGPVLRSQWLTGSPRELKDLYDRMEAAKYVATVNVWLPVQDASLEGLRPEGLRDVIRRRIQLSDSLIALIDAPGTHERTNLSVAGEAHWAAEAGKPVVVVARDPDAVDPSLRALAPVPVQSLATVDFAMLYRGIAGLAPLAR